MNGADPKMPIWCRTSADLLYGALATRYIPRPMTRTITKKGTKTKPTGALDSCA
jgi:hypothetical protein